MSPTFGCSVGLDLSLTSTGVAVVYPDRSFLHTTIKTTPAMGVVDEVERQLGIIDLVFEFIDKSTSHWFGAGSWCDLIVEGPSRGSVHGKIHERSGLWWGVMHRLVTGPSPVGGLMVVAPTTRAKYATGSGRADKRAVVEACRAIDPSLRLCDNDRADALTLAVLGHHVKTGETLFDPFGCDGVPVDRDAIVDSSAWEKLPDGWRNTGGGEPTWFSPSIKANS